MISIILSTISILCLFLTILAFTLAKRFVKLTRRATITKHLSSYLIFGNILLVLGFNPDIFNFNTVDIHKFQSHIYYFSICTFPFYAVIMHCKWNPSTFPLFASIFLDGNWRMASLQHFISSCKKYFIVPQSNYNT